MTIPEPIISASASASATSSILKQKALSTATTTIANVTKKSSSLLNYFKRKSISSSTSNDVLDDDTGAASSVKRQQIIMKKTSISTTTEEEEEAAAGSTDHNKNNGEANIDDDPLLEEERQNMANDWFSQFLPEMRKPYFLQLKRFLQRERTKHIIYPPTQDMYSFTHHPLADVRVVILGQDPYHGPQQAHGLAFSVRKGVHPPPSLVNIYEALRRDLGVPKPQHGSLVGWRDQGVLLLNASLSVRQAQPNSHAQCGWSTFTDAIIKHLNREHEHLVFMLWGAYAQKKGARIDKGKHLVLTAVHPSPLSAHRGFLECKHFSKANAYLKANGRQEIDWSHLP